MAIHGEVTKKYTIVKLKKLRTLPACGDLCPMPDNRQRLKDYKGYKFLEEFFPSHAGQFIHPLKEVTDLYAQVRLTF